jgi:Flp pilus assembly protein TadG
MAFALPVLLLLLVFVVDVARAFDAYIVLTNAAREGARFATLEPSPTQADIEQLVVVDVIGSGTSITHMADFAASDVDVVLGSDAVTVTVSYDFGLWFGGLVGVPTFPLQKQSVMPIFNPE